LFSLQVGRYGKKYGRYEKELSIAMCLDLLLYGLFINYYLSWYLFLSLGIFVFFMLW